MTAAPTYNNNAAAAPVRAWVAARSSYVAAPENLTGPAAAPVHLRGDGNLTCGTVGYGRTRPMKIDKSENLKKRSSGPHYYVDKKEKDDYSSSSIISRHFVSVSS